MKKKGMFLTSILLCISMIMTNFAGLGNGVTKAKADPNLTVVITVNNDDMGCASASTEEYGEYCGELNGTEGQTIYLCAKEYYDYSRFKEWKIIQGDGEIANPNEKNTTFTFGTENTEIQAVFEEKEKHTKLSMRSGMVKMKLYCSPLCIAVLFPCC